MRSDGFSFVEVMVSMVILSISLVILMESQSRSMDLISRAKAMDAAVTLASAKMTELSMLGTTRGPSYLKPEEGGDFDQEKHPGYRWKSRVVDVPAPDFAAMFKMAMGGDENDQNSNAALFAGPLQMIGKIWGQALKELHVEVLWKDGAREKSYELVTHLLDPNAIGQLTGAVGALTGGAGANSGAGTGSL
jgi:prepilin-type N-terminal cleavage/methylation domain-containing protein